MFRRILMEIFIGIAMFVAGWATCYVQMTYGVDQDN
jgi:hypothetical protein